MDESGPVCPKCGAENSYKMGRTDRGKKKYQCRKCGSRYMKPEDYKVYPEVPCPKCGSVGTRKAGRRLLAGGSYRQRYKCKAEDCLHSFYGPTMKAEEEKDG